MDLNDWLLIYFEGFIGFRAISAANHKNLLVNAVGLYGWIQYFHQSCYYSMLYHPTVWITTAAQPSPINSHVSAKR